ncbi:c-type cytochrome [Actibacterium lipolyticum]|uniref:Cytochrome c6 n=1 Tax=Actibacterium lipolyticum TaxID=1524263 RepID=A0A238KF64_9RHOB|nr:cytochrome c [Actibacterium lipolyticum]SMX41440.1 Cytochrome c6 [Actibacterium lipolyticum]
MGALLPIIATGLFAASVSPLWADHLFEGRDLDNGAQIYGESCASCHGAKLEGQPDWRTPRDDGTLPAPPHDASGHTWHHDTALLFNYTKFGGAKTLEARGVTGFQSGMPAFDDALTDDDIYDVLAYIRAQWPTRIQRMQAERSHALE